MSKKQQIVPIRNIFNLDKLRVMELKTNLNLQFDDNVIIKDCNYKSIIVYRFILDFITKYNIPIDSKTWIGLYYTNGYFTAGTYLNIYSYVYKSFITHNREKIKTLDSVSSIFKDMYEAVNNINRLLVVNVIEYAAQVEISEILDIQLNEKLLKSIIEANNNPTNGTILETYNVLDELMNGSEYKGNPIRMFYLSGVVSKDQIKQLLGSRGYLTEINSTIFNRPMTNSFTLGFKNNYDAAIESRAGAKALYLSTKAIQDSEYMARELQLATMVIENVVYTDCGNTDYMEFYVRPAEFDISGNITYKGDLPNLVGKYYYNEDTKQEELITKDTVNIVGKFIQLRQSISCKLSDKKSICSKCLGELSYSVFDFQNLGHLTTTEATSKATQSILSTKHLLKSASSADVKLTLEAKKYFMVKNSENIFFKANVVAKKQKKVLLKIHQRETWGLSSLQHAKDILSVNVNKVSRLTEMSLMFVSGDKVQEVIIPLKVNGRSAYLSLDLLSYIIKNGYEIPDEDNYIIDINDFNPKRPVLVYDKVEFDYAALAREFKSNLKSRKYKTVGGNIRSEYTSEVMVQRLFELLNNKLDVNIAILEVMVYAFTVMDLSERNFDVGRNGKYRDIIGFAEAINYRSIGASYGWDNLQKKVINPMLYYNKHKVSHPMDVFFKPNEVIENEIIR